MSIEVMLAALLLTTNILWAINTHRLINKLMSRSFHEYRDAGLQDLKIKATLKEPQKVPNDFEDFGALNELMS